MKIWEWLNKFLRQDKESLQRRFAENIRGKYEWQQESGMGSVCLCHRKAVKPHTSVQQINIRQLQQLIQKNMPKTVLPSVTIIQRQERTRLLAVLSDIGGQEGEQKQLEQFIFRRKEQEWRKTVCLQEEEVWSLRQELVHQKKTVETLEQRLTESVMDMDQIYREVQKRMERQLRLERQQAGW